MIAESYDIVVVGGGSSGAVVAARLSEDPRLRVLLIEAGGEARHPSLSVPLGFAKVSGDRRFTWHHATDPEPHLSGRRIPWARGRVLGGSSSVNGLVYVRGAPLDYAIWRQLGAEGWSYDDVLPVFRRSERQSRGEDAYHGGSGPLAVADAGWRTPLADAFIDAAAAIGLPRNPDFCGPTLEGAGYYQLTTAAGRRASTATAYLAPARARPNLRVVTGALVHRVEFEGRAAAGVLYERGGALYRAAAALEVVVCAGAVNSPQILQRSGVGPADLLGRHGVAVVHELKGVGENLSDHLMASRVYRTGSPHTLNALVRSPLKLAAAGLRYAVRRSGPLAIGAAQAGAFASTRPGLDAPDVQMFLFPFALKPGTREPAPHSGFNIGVYQNRPESRGRVRIASADPRERGTIAANYLDREADRRTLVAGLRLAGRIAAAEPLRRLGAEQTEPAGDGSDEALLDHIRATAYTAYHHCGTCRMGADALAVVDPQLRAIGLSKLRVADGSVMPTVISGNTNAACIMIGERCADFIRAALPR